MNTVLAIYDALLQAGVPDAPARRVVEALEQDMTTLLANKQDLFSLKQDVMLVKQDLSLVKQDVQAARQEIRHLEEKTTLKFEALGDRISSLHQNLELRLQAVESRVVIKLSVVMTALITAAGTLLAVFN
jgi:hypothetical protein